MTRFNCGWSTDGLWYTLSHKDEKVLHLFRIGTTHLHGVKIYELIIGKLLLQISFNAT